MKSKPKTLTNILEDISSSSNRSRSDVLRAFVHLSACCLTGGMKEGSYLDEAKGWNRSQMDEFGVALGTLISQMEEQPYTDLLGPLHMEWGSLSDHQHRGAFYTPKDVCRLCARLTIPDDLPADGPITIHEPACGSAAMLLATAEVLADRGINPTRLRVACEDIDVMAVRMAFINLSLWGIPAVVRRRNSLTLEEWEVWTTAPFHLLGASLKATEEPPMVTLQGNQYAIDFHEVARYV